MKNVLIILAITLFGFNGVAQSEFAKMMREMYREEFIEVVNENMNLSEADDAVFQPIFQEFLGELHTVMDMKIQSQRKFAQYFEGMTDEQAKTVVGEVFTNRKAYDKMLKKYEKKIGKSLGYQTSFRFFLIVEKVASNFEYSMKQNLPLVKN